MQERSDQIIDMEYLNVAFEQQLDEYADRSNEAAFAFSTEQSLAEHYNEMAWEERVRLDPYADNINRLMDINYD